MPNRSSTKVKQDRKAAARKRVAKMQPTASEGSVAPGFAADAAVSNPNHSRRPNPSSKLGIVLGLLEAPGGATLAQLVKVTAWLPHSTRAALTGLRKRGFAVVGTKTEADRVTRYRIGSEAT